MCLVSGALYGANFAPVIYIKDNYPAMFNYTKDVSSKGTLPAEQSN